MNRTSRQLRPIPILMGGFTLIELLMVVAILGVIAAMLLPALARARGAGKKAACISNLKQLGIAVQSYAHDHDGLIPYGPVAPPFTSPASFYPSTGTPTSLISLRSGEPVGLGLMLRDYLSSTPQVLFCPGTDQSWDAESELAKVGKRQAQGSYYYRHAGVVQLFHTPVGIPENLRLDDLGRNRKGEPIRVLVVDSQFLAPPGLESFNILTRTHHQTRFVNALFADGHVEMLQNVSNRFVVDLQSGSIQEGFERILQVFENADTAR